MTTPPHPDVRPLFPDAGETAARWSERAGLSFVNHVLVVKASLTAEHPWLTDELVDLFDAARLEAGRRSEIAALASGLDANRAPIEAASRYAHAQGITPRYATAAELFPS